MIGFDKASCTFYCPECIPASKNKNSTANFLDENTMNEFSDSKDRNDLQKELKKHSQYILEKLNGVREWVDEVELRVKKL